MISDIRTKQLEHKIDDLSFKVNRILNYVDSDEATKRKGVVEQLDELTTTVSKLLTREQVYKAKAVAFGTIGGGLVMAVWKAVTFLVTITK